MALSKDFKGKLVMGEVRQRETELVEKYGIKNFPTLLVVTDPENHRGVAYEGKFNKEQIMKFLREYAYTTAKK